MRKISVTFNKVIVTKILFCTIKYIKKYWKHSVVFVPPLVLILLSLGFPFDKKLVEIEVFSKIVNYPPEKILKPNLLTALSDALQISLHLENFEIYFKNTSKYTTNVYFGDSDNCNKLPSKDALKVQGFIGGKSFNTSEIYINKESESFPYKRGDSIEMQSNFILKGGDECTREASGIMYLSKNKYEWFGKALFIFIFWILFLPALVDIVNFLNKRNGQN